MKINKVELKNFKCFKDTLIIPKRITLLTGKNSSGKSSIIYGVLGAIQSGEFPLQFSPNGKYVTMGDFKEIVYNHNRADNISLNFEIGFKNDTLSVNSLWKESPSRNLPELKSLNVKSKSFQLSIEKVRKYHFHYSPGEEENMESPFSSELFKGIMEKLTEIAIENKKLKEKDRIEVKGLLKRTSINKKFSFTFSDFDQIRGEIISNGSLNAVNHYETVVNIFKRLDRKINFISSFRLFPQRTYYQTSKEKLKIGKFGENYEDQIALWEANRAPEFKRLKENLQKIDLLHSINTNNLEGGRFEILVTSRKGGIKASLNDVGFGISQFLPVLVADLQLSGDSTLFIAQPEIHLHPEIQASLANYLVDQIKSTDKSYIIETHSEYLINRLRLLIAEEKVSSDDVGVYYIKNNGNFSETIELEFLKSGQIKHAPKEFFETYMMDMIDLSINAK